MSDWAEDFVDRMVDDTFEHRRGGQAQEPAERSGRPLRAGQRRCPHCEDTGWQHPELGVNLPAGAAVAVSVLSAVDWLRGREYRVRCPVCNPPRPSGQEPEQ